MFTFIKDLFRKREQSSAILCPHCEKPASEGHECSRWMSRRIFLGALGGAAAAVVVAPALVVKPGGLFNPVADIAGQYARGKLGGNRFLTADEIARECLKVLKDNMDAAREVNRRWRTEFDVAGPKIGCTLRVPRSAKFHEAVR